MFQYRKTWRHTETKNSVIFSSLLNQLFLTIVVVVVKTSEPHLVIMSTVMLF